MILMDTEAQKVPEAAAPPPSRRRRRLVGAAAFVALVLLSLGELLLPLADVGERQQQLAEREQDQRDESGRADQAAAAAARRRRSRLRHFLRLRVHQYHALRRRPASCRLPRNANPRRAGPSTSTPVLWALGQLGRSLVPLYYRIDIKVQETY